MTKQEANAEIAKLLKVVDESIVKAQKLADEHGLSFTLSIPDALHLKDTFRGKALVHEDNKTWYENNLEELEEDYPNGQWCSSSAYC